MKWSRFLIIQVVSIVIVSAFAYPTMEEARRLFPLNSTAEEESKRNPDLGYEFCQELGRGGTYEQKIEMESYLIASITTSVNAITITTNTSGYSPWCYVSKHHFSKELDLLLRMDLYKTNAVQCEAIAAYTGTLQCMEMPKELLELPPRPPASPRKGKKSAGGIVAAEPEDPSRYAAWIRRQKLLENLKISNRGIRQQREEIIAGLRHAVFACSEIMSEDEFAAFSNRLVRLSRVTPIEEQSLFFIVQSMRKKSRTEEPCEVEVIIEE